MHGIGCGPARRQVVLTELFKCRECKNKLFQNNSFSFKLIQLLFIYEQAEKVMKRRKETKKLQDICRSVLKKEKVIIIIT